MENPDDEIVYDGELWHDGTEVVHRSILLSVVAGVVTSAFTWWVCGQIQRKTMDNIEVRRYID